MTQIAELAYKVKFDARQLTKGLLSTRQQVAASKKIIADMQSPLQRYITGMDNLRAITARNTEVAKHANKIGEQLERQYLEETKTLSGLNREQQRRLEILTQEERILAKSSKAEEQREQRLQRTRQRIQEQNRKGGLSTQASIRRITVDVDAQQAAGRAALHERLQRFKATRLTDEQRSVRRPTIVDQFAAADHFGRFSPSAGSHNIAAGMPMKRTRDTRTTSAPASPLMLGAKVAGGLLAGKVAFDTAAGFRKLIGESETLNAELERTNAAFDVFTGSSTKTKVLIADMKRLSALSGVTFSALSFGASTMMGYGEVTEDASVKLKQMAAITRGDSERLKAMAFAMGQVRGNGKLMAQELLQMINAGFNPLAEIARTTGKTMAELRAEMEEGKISVDMVSNALKTATEAGGRYNGMLEKIAETTAGTLSKNQAAWEQARADIGKAIAPITEVRAGLSTAFAESISKSVTAASQDISGLLEQARVTIEVLRGVPGGRTIHSADEREAFVDPREAARQRRIAAVTATKTEEAARAKTIEEERTESKKHGLDQIQGLTVSALEGQVPEEDMKRFNRMLSLMDDVQKKRATIDFAEYRSLETVASYLDEEVQKELNKLEIIEKQSEARRKLVEQRESFRQGGESLTERFADPGERLRKQLTDLQVMLSIGAITKDVFNKAKDQAANESIEKQSPRVAPNLRVGSQEAYAAMFGARNSAAERALREQQKQAALQAQQLRAQQEANRILAEMKEQQIGNAG